MGLNSLPSFVSYSFDQILATVSATQFVFSLIRHRVWPLFRLLQFVSALNLFLLFVYLPFSYTTQGTLLGLLRYIGAIVLVTNVLVTFAYLVPLRFCFRNPLPEMHWIGAALLFLFFEDADRYLTRLRALNLPNLTTVPQSIRIGMLYLDIRALAYLTFAIVMLVAMTVRFRRVQARNLLVGADLEAARTVQRLLVSSQAPETPGFTIESVYLPAQEVGGDFFHVAPRPMGPYCWSSAMSPAKA